MGAANEPTKDLSSTAWARRERLIERFERAWRRGEQPSLDDYLEEVPGADWQAALTELVQVDLEYRLEAGEKTGAEVYLQRYPALAEDRAAVLALIAREFELRRRRQPDLSLNKYLPRFPDYRDELQAILKTQSDRASGSELKTLPPGVRGQRPPTELPTVPGYEILGILGRGGMGVVYKARELRRKRLVALKMILIGVHAGKQELARFQTEAQAIARLQHPNIVQAHEIGESDGRPFFTLELMEGGSLAEQLDGTPWPPRKAARLVRTLARAVHHAHQRNVIHRDLKPANVLLTADGTPKITDFGLARQLDASGCSTPSDAVLGTPSYMAPEQAGQAKHVGPAADIYALGAILYQLLTGRPPFMGGTTVDIIMQVVAEDPASPREFRPNLSVDLETICLKCLHKDPKQRYPSAKALANDLRRFVADEPVRAKRSRPWDVMLTWTRRNPVLAFFIAVLALLFLLSLFLSFRFR